MTRKALVIGINEYPYEPLAYAVKDALQIAEILSRPECGFEVITLIDEQATRDNIISKLRDFSKENLDTFVIFIAGHAKTTSSQTAFITYDTHLIETPVYFNELAQLAAGACTPGGSIIFLLDCCHAGAFEPEPNVSIEDPQKRIAIELDLPYTAALLACTFGAKARESKELEHGVFSYFLSRGLSGDASASDGIISPSRLFDYVSRRMISTSRQVPVFKTKVEGVLALARWSVVSKEEQAREDFENDLTKLDTSINDLDMKLAEFRPPFMQRDKFWSDGWIQASNFILPVVRKRERIIQKWGQRYADSHKAARLDAAVNDNLQYVSNIVLGMKIHLGTVEKNLGAGGFGSVYKIKCDDGVEVAWKVFHGNELRNRQKLERFRIGIEAMEMLNHPAIVNVKKRFDSPPSFSMQLIQGSNLEEGYSALDSIEDKLRFLLGVTETLVYAHGRGVLHRDIKPTNVMMRWSQTTSRWEPVLTDFDLAWFTTATSHTIDAFGAPHYAAPEQTAKPGSPEAHSETVDIYAMAMLTMFMFIGQAPHDVRATLDTVVDRFQRSSTQAASTELRDLLEKASQRDYRSRPNSMETFRSQLQTILEHHLSISDPDAILEELDFAIRVIGLLGYAIPANFDNPEKGVISLSGRTKFSFEWDKRQIAVIFDKIDGFTATQTSHEAARFALAKAIDDIVTKHKTTVRENWNGGIRRVGAGKKMSAQGSVRIEIDGIGRNDHGARFVSHLVSSVISVYERF